MFNKEASIQKQPKGYQCSVNGKNYEYTVYSVVKNCSFYGKLFNTQKENELGGSSKKMISYVILSNKRMLPSKQK